MTPIRWLVLLLTLGGLGGLAAWRLATRTGPGQAGSGAGPIAVSVAKVARTTELQTVVVTGVVRPRREAEVVAKVPGRVEQVLVELGQPVKAGQLLAVVEHEELGWQARQAQSAVGAAEAGLENARQTLQAVDTQFARVKALKEAEAIPQAELERAEATLQGARTGVKAAEAQLGSARAAAGLAWQMVKNAELRSPIDGVVSRRSVEVGGQASPQTPPFQIVDLTMLRLEAPVEPQELLRIRAGQPVAVTSGTAPGAVLQGTVAAVGPGLDPMARRGTVEIDIVAGEGPSRLLPNQLARATIEVGRRENALAVPQGALVEQGGSRQVFVVRGEKAQQVALKAPESAGDVAFVDGELAEGERVVLTGREALFDGAAIVVSEELPGPTGRPR